MSANVPPVGSPCWIEIPASDVQACKKFYSSLFPSWEFRPPQAPYTEETMASWSFSAPRGLTGGIVQVPASCKESELKMGIGFTVYHFVESIDETKKRIEELGGTSCSGLEKAGDHGVYMLFKDVEGNRFGVYQGIGGEDEGGH